MWKVLFIENTNRCNIQCPGCKRPRTGNQDMSEEVYEAALSTFAEEPIDTVSFFWRGEPTLDSRLPEWVETAKSRGYMTYTSTNTVTPLLHNRDYVLRLLKSLDRICICVDGYDQETLAHYRKGSNWRTLIKNLETIARIKTECKKEMRTLMFKYNEGHEDDFIRMAKKYKMDTLNFGLPIINGRRVLKEREAEVWLADNKKYRRYKVMNKRWVHKSRAACTMIPIISVTGEIAPCCYDWKIEHSLGNVLHDSIETINKNVERIWAKAWKMQLPMCSRDCFNANTGVNVIQRLS